MPAFPTDYVVAADCCRVVPQVNTGLTQGAKPPRLRGSLSAVGRHGIVIRDLTHQFRFPSPALTCVPLALCVRGTVRHRTVGQWYEIAPPWAATHRTRDARLRYCSREAGIPGPPRCRSSLDGGTAPCPAPRPDHVLLASSAQCPKTHPSLLAARAQACGISKRLGRLARSSCWCHTGDGCRSLRASEGDTDMFSVGQRVWHRDGQRSGTVLEFDRDRVFIAQDNGVEVHFRASDLLAAPPAGAKTSDAARAAAYVMRTAR